MTNRITNGLELAAQCFRVLRLDKELIVFPLLSSLGLMAVMASFALPLWETDYVQVFVDCFHDNDEEAGEKFLAISRDPIYYALLFCFYLAQYFVVTFFNTALVACAIVRFNGGDPNVAVGLRFARARLGVILAWSVFSAAVSVVLRFIESSSSIGARIVAGLLGMAWGIGTFFVVPVLVVEKLGPLAALKRSVAVIQRTWGEALVASIGFGAIEFLLFVVALIPAVVGGFVNVAYATAIGIGVTAFLLASICLISSTLQSILLAALYLYADQGKVPDGFDEAYLRNAFQKR